MQIHIGTSGWHYDHWKGAFYPEALPRNNYLEYYADIFHTLEINNSFYQMPQEKTLVQWRNSVPKNFIFSLKASRYITHIKKLKDGRQILPPFIKKVEILGDRMGPILFQLPPQWRFNLDRLTSFLKALPSEFRYAFEFRDSSWFNPRTYDVLAQYGAAFCIYHVASRSTPKELTADFVYVRFHGPKSASQGKYDSSVLSEWAENFIAWSSDGKEVFCYFDNDEFGFAAQDASELQQIVDIRFSQTAEFAAAKQGFRKSYAGSREIP
jgi:uncharacterized protein YecE (DUF72 family)